jgi:hypothetical protein
MVAGEGHHHLAHGLKVMDAQFACATVSTGRGANLTSFNHQSDDGQFAVGRVFFQGKF